MTCAKKKEVVPESFRDLCNVISKVYCVDWSGVVDVEPEDKVNEDANYYVGVIQGVETEIVEVISCERDINFNWKFVRVIASKVWGLDRAIAIQGELTKFFNDWDKERAWATIRTLPDKVTEPQQ